MQTVEPIQSEVINSSDAYIISVIVAVIVVLIVILMIVVGIINPRSATIIKSIPNKVIVNENKTKNAVKDHVEDKKNNMTIGGNNRNVPVITPNPVIMVDRIIQIDRNRRRGGIRIGDQNMAGHLYNTLRAVNILGALTTPRLPFVIDIAVEPIYNNNPQIDRELQRVLLESANQTRDKIISRRREVAKSEPTPAARIDKYIELSTFNTVDPENSHDTYVNKCLQDIMAILREDQKDQDLPSLSHIRNCIKLKYDIIESPDTKTVLNVIDIIYNDGVPLYNDAIKATDTEVLQRVWLRSFDPKNSANKENMQHMIYNSLESCWEGNSIVCINGRCSKLLSVLVELDHDPRTHVLRTLEQQKNILFEQIRELIKERARIATRSLDPEVQKIGQSYLATSSDDMPKDLDEGKVKDFQLYLRNQIAKYVQDNCKTLPETVMKHVINECIAAV
jgi:hypothetical protein